VAIARDHTWLEHADQAEIVSAAETVDALR
jgi:hypothetical protein